MTVRESAVEARRDMPRTTTAASTQMSLLVDGSVMGITAAPGSHVSLLSQMARSLPSV